jgi:hypothetical protein
VRADRPIPAIESLLVLKTDPKEGHVMFNVAARTSLIGGSVTVLALVVTVSTLMAASASTTMFLGALSVAPAIVIALLHKRLSPSVGEMLHSAAAKEGRV